MSTAMDLAHTLFTAYNCHDPIAAGALYLPDGVHTEMSRGEGRQGRAAITSGLAYLMCGFPDARWRVRDVIATEDRVVVTYLLTGSLRADFGPFAAQGQ